MSKQRINQFGKVFQTGRPKKDPSERFWSLVYITEGCWLWIGGIDKDGYGKFTNDGKTIRAHRFAYEDWFKVIIPDDMKACHKCDNPACCNPFHIFQGTSRDNTQDMLSKKRGRHG